MYWDASALVPLVIAEPATAMVHEWFEADSRIVTWAWTRVELAGAVERRARDGAISRSMRREALERFEALADTWDEVTDILAVRARAMSILARHPLRAADAAQLGAALLLGEPNGERVRFACLDHRLAEAGEREGLRVMPL